MCSMDNALYVKIDELLNSVVMMMMFEEREREKLTASFAFLSTHFAGQGTILDVGLHFDDEE
jgi:hypothetical protein